jgi:hypothetical protein
MLSVAVNPTATLVKTANGLGQGLLLIGRPLPELTQPTSSPLGAEPHQGMLIRIFRSHEGKRHNDKGKNEAVFAILTNGFLVRLW